MDNKTSNIEVFPLSKPSLITDLDPSYVKEGIYSHARNIIKNTKEGNSGTLSSEPSNKLSYLAPYKIIGVIVLPDDTHLVFSTDNKNSEIGIGNPITGKYKKIIGLSCLNFNQDYPITGVVKKDFNKNMVVYFTDKYNPYRRLDLGKIDKVKTCDDILLFKKIQHPCINARKGLVGNLPNGTYSVCIAYTVDNKVFSDWVSISNRLMLYSENNTNAITVDISDLDDEFSEFALCVVANYIDPVTKGATKVAKIVGYYSSKTKTIDITDITNPTNISILLSNLVIQKRTWVKGGIITSNSNTLFLADLVSRKEENYQLSAFEIEAEYVVKQVPLEYYENSGDEVGYYRDENYDFYIQGVYNTGETTDKFHIAGRKAKNDDKSPISNADVFEFDNSVKCDKLERVEKWMVENTAEKMTPINEEFVCDQRIIGKGKMGYHESTEMYPDNPKVYGEYANTPILYHRMPDEEKVPRYTVINNKTYINILGVRFKNIPKFKDPDIIGYKITRSDRKGGNGTVVSRGLMTNMRSYDDLQAKEEIYYNNYTLNDLSPDAYLSATQVVRKGKGEKNFKPLTKYHNDKFAYYSPHTLFEPKYSITNELKIEAEEIADIKGKFEIVHNHPKFKILNQFSFWAALVIGLVEATYEALGLKNQTESSGSGNIGGTALTTGGTGPGTITFPPGITGVGFSFSATGKDGGSSAISIAGEGLKTITTALKSIIKSIKDPLQAAKFANYLKAIGLITGLIATLGVGAVLLTTKIMQYADEILNIIYNFNKPDDYVYQYNAAATFRKSIPSKKGFKRRAIIESKYIPSEVVSINDMIINNKLREKFVYLQLNKEIKEPNTKDNSRNTITGFGIKEDREKQVKSTGSAFYVTNKVTNRNQYNTLGSSGSVSMHSCVFTDYSETPVLFGGDCIIARMFFLKKMQFFSQNLANANFPDNTEYDYRLYRNIAYPRFWIDSSRYDYSELLSRPKVNYSTFTRTATNQYNLDGINTKHDKKLTTISDCYMYLFNNCAVDFICEADYNISFREEGKNIFYSNKNKSLSRIFRSDVIEEPEEFLLNRAYSDIYTTEIYAPQQRKDFDPDNPIPISQPNSVIYSLPSYNLQNIDNWQYFLPANIFNFSEVDFGELTSIHGIDQDRLIFLFTKASPFISMGRSLLQLNDQTVTIGDGGIFAQDPRELMPTSNNYGACTSRYAFSNNQFGRYYPSKNQGRIIAYTQSLDDISRTGVSYWCKNYMPIQLYLHFPTYNQPENPVSGVGYLTVFDSFYETQYFTKRDFIPIVKGIEEKDGKFYYDGVKIELRDSRYFKDISWTMSYSPGDKAFVSWHDWHPDLVIQEENHFYTVKDNGVWKHNDRFDSFCNFYNNDYPMEIEPISAMGQSVMTIRNLEYLLEVYKYKNFGRDKFHVHHENFSHLIVHNTEQISPLLNLKYANPNPEENLKFPSKSTNISFDVVYFKEENKYRINQFWDTTKDRGEFTTNEYHLFPTDESGYKNVINPVAIDVNKPEEQRKKFRHYFTKFRLIKDKLFDKNFIFKIINIKQLISPR